MKQESNESNTTQKGKQKSEDGIAWNLLNILIQLLMDTIQNSRICLQEVMLENNRHKLQKKDSNFMQQSYLNKEIR